MSINGDHENDVTLEDSGEFLRTAISDENTLDSGSGPKFECERCKSCPEVANAIAQCNGAVRDALTSIRKDVFRDISVVNVPLRLLD